MKLIHCNGNELTVRDAGPPILTIKRRAGGPPIKFNGYCLLEDRAARALVREQLNVGLYDYVKV